MASKLEWQINDPAGEGRARPGLVKLWPRESENMEGFLSSSGLSWGSSRGLRRGRGTRASWPASEQ